MPSDTHAPQSVNGSPQSFGSPSAHSRAGDTATYASQAPAHSPDGMSGVPYQVSKTARGERIKPRRPAQSATPIAGSTLNPRDGRESGGPIWTNVKSSCSMVGTIMGLMGDALTAFVVPEEDWPHASMSELEDRIDYVNMVRNKKCEETLKRSGATEDKKEKGAGGEAEDSVCDEKRA